MSKLSQTRAESSIRPSAPPLITLEDLERPSSPSSLEHNSTAASPTDSPTLEGKGKVKAVETKDVTKETEEEASSSASAPNVGSIEPEEASNLNDIPLIGQETEPEVLVKADIPLLWEETEPEAPLKSESLAAEDAESEPAVYETEWKEESSENKAYVEGYNDALHDIEEERKLTHCIKKHRQPCCRGRCEPQPHRLPGHPDPRFEAADLRAGTEQEVIDVDSESLPITNPSLRRGHNHCVECRETMNETPEQERRARRPNPDATGDVTWQNYYHRLTRSNQADIRQIEQALGPLESLLAGNFPNHPTLDDMRWRRELETERRFQRELQRQEDQATRQAELQEQARAQVAPRAESQARRDRERAQESPAAVSTAYIAPWALPIHSIGMRTTDTSRHGVNTNATVRNPHRITIVPRITIHTRRPAQSANPQQTSSQSTRLSAGTSQARGSQVGSSQAGISRTRNSRASGSQVGTSSEKGQKKKRSSKH